MKKIKSSAIYYALFLSIIFALILGGLILFSGFNQRFALQMDVEEILIENAKSGVAYGQANFKELVLNEPVKLRLFGEGIDSVELVKNQWGAFTVMRSTALHKNRRYTKIALLGGANRFEKPVNLYLVDNGRPVSICGNARIEGNCFLPKSGFKRAYIEGKNYQGLQFVYGTVQESQKQLPPVNPNFTDGLNQVFTEIEFWRGDEDSIVVSFADKGKHYLNDRFIILDQCVVKGQVMLEAADSIFVSRNAVIEHAILKSKVVYVESGFSGTLQIFASQKILLGEAVQLRYPSVLGVIEEEFPTQIAAEISLGEKSQVIGAVFMTSAQPNFRLLPTLNIVAGAEVDGLVYCAGKTQLRGTIKGGLYSEKLFLRTASSAYENHLLDGQLLDQLPPNFVVPNLLNENTHLKHIAWLN